ncbi:hypothetical protein NE237_002121 [Protea cynaroides]|uniref:Uncharacterized protein n=1 Tax=Protea cynaroides TaxID=273540 RepID=A0A9Q0KUL9_9MAGN|nr:hypothetical protein NE237_002121 [Protea cynaroides]
MKALAQLLTIATYFPSKKGKLLIINIVNVIKRSGIRIKKESSDMLSPTCLCFLLFQFITSATVSSKDTLTPTESITDGQIVVSTGNNYALGFFSPGNSSYGSTKFLNSLWFGSPIETTHSMIPPESSPLPSMEMSSSLPVAIRDVLSGPPMSP